MKTFNILFPPGVSPQEAKQEQPVCFPDLNLDQVITAITASKKDYDLKALFCTPLADRSSILYRQDVMCDLENPALFAQTNTFSKKLFDLNRSIDSLINRSPGPFSGIGYLDKGRFLEAVKSYCGTVTDFAEVLDATVLRSAGLLAARGFFQIYVRSESFAVLQTDTAATKQTMSTVRYCMLIKDGTIRVQKYEGETNYTDEIVSTFEKFNEGAVESYLQKIPDEPYAAHIEEGVMGLLSGLFPNAFATLDGYFSKHIGFLDKTILAFALNVQFYSAYLSYIFGMKKAGLPFCYPKIVTEDKEIVSNGGFDIALAAKLTGQGIPVVQNDFYLSGPERAIIISGPNQGGKTTFARAFGQTHYLASLGCCVPGTDTSLYLFDQIFTHFEVEEKVESLNGKLQDELIRVHSILEQATDHSIVIINEIFASTSLSDAVFIGKRLMKKITDAGMLCVCVTFLEELSRLNDATVSMVSTVVPETPEKRTFKIMRKPTDGLAYAMFIAGKHSLTYEAIRGRLAK